MPWVFEEDELFYHETPMPMSGPEGEARRRMPDIDSAQLLRPPLLCHAILDTALRLMVEFVRVPARRMGERSHSGIHTDTYTGGFMGTDQDSRYG